MRKKSGWLLLLLGNTGAESRERTYWSMAEVMLPTPEVIGILLAPERIAAVSKKSLVSRTCCMGQRQLMFPRMAQRGAAPTFTRTTRGTPPVTGHDTVRDSVRDTIRGIARGVMGIVL
jgi:hypothetical protein